LFENVITRASAYRLPSLHYSLVNNRRDNSAPLCASSPLIVQHITTLSDLSKVLSILRSVSSPSRYPAKHVNSSPSLYHSFCPRQTPASSSSESNTFSYQNVLIAFTFPYTSCPTRFTFKNTSARPPTSADHLGLSLCFIRFLFQLSRFPIRLRLTS
jgi:hypothetical protein